MEVEVIKKADDRHFELFWEVYNYSFPQHEKRTLESQIRAIEQQGCVIEAFLEDGEFIGFLVYWEFGTYLYVEHFALSKQVRSNGYGSKILSAFVERHSNQVVVLDIDPIVDEITERRRNFYLRLGFIQNPYYHLHPSYRGRDGEKYELLLMTNPRELTPSEYETFKDSLYNKIVTY